jgi:hypothetical protein
MDEGQPAPVKPARFFVDDGGGRLDTQHLVWLEHGGRMGLGSVPSPANSPKTTAAASWASSLGASAVLMVGFSTNSCKVGVEVCGLLIDRLNFSG